MNAPKEKRLPKLIGRELELERLFSLLSNTLRGSSPLIEISGEAGIGKSRLTREVISAAQEMGFSVFEGKCEPSIEYSMKPFLEILATLPHMMRSQGREWFNENDIARYEKSIKEIINVDNLSESFLLRPENALFIFIPILNKLAKKNPLLFVIEDFQWADSASVQLLNLLAKNMRYERLCIIVTYRPEDVTSQIRQFVLEALMGLVKEGLASHIEIRRIGEEAAFDILAPILGTDISEVTSSRIWADCKGNPFFMIETAMVIKETGKYLSPDNEISEKVRIPSTITDVIKNRMIEVSQEERELLDASAIIGRNVDFTILSEIISKDIFSVLSDLDHVERRTGLISLGDSQLSFEHEMIRQTLLDGMDPSKKMELSRRIAVALEKTVLDEATVAKLAHHFLNAGDIDKTRKYSYLAANNCLLRSAVLEALFYLNIALQNCLENDPIRDEIFEKTGDAKKDMADFEGAMESYGILIQNPGNIPYARVLRKCAECYVPTRLGKGGAQKALELLNKAEIEGGVEDFEMGEIASDRSTLALWTGNPREALRYSTLAEGHFKKAGTNARLALEMTEKAIVMMSLGDVHGSKEEVEVAMEINQRFPNPYGECEMHQVLGMSLLHMGHFKNACMEEDSSIRISEALEYHYISCWSLIIKSMASLMSHDLVEFGERVNESAKKAEMSGSIYQRAGCHALKAIHLNMIGQRDEGVGFIVKAEELMNSFDWTISSPMHGIIKLAQAELALTQDPEVKDDLYFEALEAFNNNTWGYFFTGITHLLAGDAAFFLKDMDIARSHWEESKVMFSSMGNERIVDMIERRTGPIPD